MKSRGWLLLLLALTAGHAAWLSAGLVYPDLARDYPHQESDSCEWLSNGLHQAGFPTRDTVRPPLYPWLLAQAVRTGTLAWVPVFQQLVLVVGALLLFSVLVERHAGSVAAGVSLAFFLGQRFQSLGLDLMADHLVAVMLFGCLVAFGRAAQRPDLYLPGVGIGDPSDASVPEYLVMGYKAFRVQPKAPPEAASASKAESVLMLLDRGVVRNDSAQDVDAEVWSQARRVRESLPRPDSLVALFPCENESSGAGSSPDAAARVLALSLGTPSLFLGHGAERQGLRRLIDAGEQDDWRSLGVFSLRSVSAGGWNGWEVKTPCPETLPGPGESSGDAQR